MWKIYGKTTNENNMSEILKAEEIAELTGAKTAGAQSRVFSS